METLADSMWPEQGGLRHPFPTPRPPSFYYIKDFYTIIKRWEKLRIPRLVVLAARDSVGCRQVRHLGVLSRDCGDCFVFDTLASFAAISQFQMLGRFVSQFLIIGGSRAVLTLLWSRHDKCFVSRTIASKYSSYCCGMPLLSDKKKQKQHD